MNSRTRRWIRWEQTLNERLSSDGTSTRLVLDGDRIRPSLRPDTQPTWTQQVVWLPRDRVRVYGRAEVLHRALGAWRPGRAPLLLHPQAPVAHRHASRTFGVQTLTGRTATPTASYRTVVLTGRGPTVSLKLSLGMRTGPLRRSVSERDVAVATVISRLLETIPASARARVGLDWFPEPAGLVERESRTGWLLREMPGVLRRSATGELMPVFSLVATQGSATPLLVDLIREARARPEPFIVRHVLGPYVRVLAYLLFEEGIQVEGHAQNILVELGSDQRLTGRIVLRDLADMSVSLAMRLARQKSLPPLRRDVLPRDAPFAGATVAADHTCNGHRWKLLRARDTVERAGLRAFVWTINTSMTRYFSRYDDRWVEKRYLELWRDEAVAHLGIEPIVYDNPRGLATDEALSCFLSRVDWRSLGAAAGVALSSGAEPLLLEGRARRRRGAVYARLRSPWGELFLQDNQPVFFTPAF